MSPVTAAYAHLTEEGLFRQHVIRYAALLEDTVEVLTILTDEAVLERLRLHARCIEAYAGTPLVVRLVGAGRLLRALLALPAGLARLYFVQKRETQRVRFCYELFFLPKTGSWAFSRDHLLRHLRGDP
jgi:hypothetical protein